MTTSSEVFHFDEFTLDVPERRLLRGAEAVRLSPKAYDVLVAFVQQRGRLVTKDDLLKRLWPKSFVEEGGLSVHVSALRKALGENAHRPIYIETVARSDCALQNMAIPLGGANAPVENRIDTSLPPAMADEAAPWPPAPPHRSPHMTALRHGVPKSQARALYASYTYKRLMMGD